MFSFQIVETFTNAPLNLVSGLSELLLVENNGTAILYGATRGGGGVLALNVNGPITLLDSQAIPTGARLPAEATLDIITFAGNRHLVVSGSSQPAVLTYRLDAVGALVVAVKPAGSLAGVISAQTQVQLGGQTYFFASRSDEASVHVYSMAANGASTLVQELQLFPDAQGEVIAALLPVTVAGQSYIAAVSPLHDQLVLLSVAANGTLAVTASLGAHNGLGIDGPSEISAVSAYGRTFVLMTSASSSSLTLVEVVPGGQLRVADHIIDTLDTRFQGIQAAEAVVVDGRAFVVVGGGDMGLQLLMILPDGHLLPVATVLSMPGTALDNIAAITLRVVGTVLDIFVGSEGTGITRLQVDVGAAGQVLGGGGGNDTILGGSSADILCGDAGDDQLFANAGNDVLCDGTGSDLLSGGAGADTFVFASDGSTDVITDFQLGIDRIDLSEWGRIYRLEDLQITATATGAEIRYGDEVLRLQSSNGLPIQASQLTRESFVWAWHAPTSMRSEDGSILGTDGADFLVGTVGSDKFIASEGQDTIMGGDGLDQVDYSAAQTGLRVDLQYSETNLGMAQGQALSQIEDIVGSGLADILAGSAAANGISGGAGADLMDGRGGNDTLLGGAGNDVLVGGAGADRLDGGAGVDRASWWSSATGLRIDAAYGYTNTGEAIGDVLSGIEEIEGSGWNDTLGGSNAADLLIGGSGADALDGRGGNDTLRGGSGNDSLAGGTGSDLLDGGEGAGDLANYWSSVTGLRVSLAQPGLNTGEAAGDIFTGIEGVSGSQFNDTLSGDAQHNILTGGAGNDSLEGAAGNDSLNGDAGADILLGGAGADQLNGGTGGHDVVSYATASTGLRADLIYAHTNTGDAMGDTYFGVEDILATAYADIIGGNGLDNVINGNLGNDTVDGRAGNDTLGGHDGDDILAGGLGNDVLVGGAGADVFVFSSGRDVTLDFQDNVDTIMILPEAWGGGSRTVSQILAPQNVAVVAGTGLVITLSPTASLTVAGVYDVAVLQNDILLG